MIVLKTLKKFYHLINGNIKKINAKFRFLSNLKEVSKISEGA